MVLNPKLKFEGKHLISISVELKKFQTQNTLNPP
jgi:hypothetical protein